MIDVILFIGRIVLVVLLYIFLFAVMKTGVGLVRGQRRDSAIWTIDVDKGPRGIRGIHVDMLGPVIVGLLATTMSPAAPMVGAAVLTILFVGAFALVGAAWTCAIAPWTRLPGRGRG